MASQEDPNGPDPQVLIIMTGGTICMVKVPEGLIPARGFLDTCLRPEPSFNDRSKPGPLEVMEDRWTKTRCRSLRTPVSAYGKQVRYTVLEFTWLIDSSSIDAAGWSQIAEVVYHNYRRFDGFVILHGTDSLAYTCSALSFMMKNLGKPVILTGSQMPMSELQSDANENLLGALIIAGHFMIPEVCLFFHHKLLRGNRSTKISANDFDAFSTPNYPALATISSVKTNVSWPLIYRSNRLATFSLVTELETAVACLRIFPGIMPEMVEGVLKIKSLRGLVLETFGAGNAPAGADGQLTKVIGSAVKRGIVVVNVTQCISGSVRQVYAASSQLSKIGVVFGHDMTSEAALTKLCHLLGQEMSVDEVRKKMAISLRGELTDTSTTHFEHPDAQFTQSDEAKVSALGYAIARGDLSQVEHLLKGDQHHLLETPDYSGNTPVHLAACNPEAAVLKHLLSLGASVHIRNRAGRTALFMAASAELENNIKVLTDAGAHLHTSELRIAKVKAFGNEKVWILAGIKPADDGLAPF
ncbi:MAG: hypothetical protein M1814_003717 [Vezdaea aestivalis]|nr:MAG: hypothetical protein M1814_003717 [Vezdaea aestivalis]